MDARGKRGHDDSTKAHPALGGLLLLDFQVLEALVLFVDGEQIDTALQDRVIELLEPGTQLSGIDLEGFDQHHRVMGLNALGGARQGLQLHALDVHFYQIEAGGS